MSTQTGVIVLVVGIVAAGVLAVVVSRWALKMDRRAKRRQQRAVQRRHRSDVVSTPNPAAAERERRG